MATRTWRHRFPGRQTVGPISREHGVGRTIEDQKAYLRPWTVEHAFDLTPDYELLEGFCDNHEKTMEHRRIAPAPDEPPSPPLGQTVR
jgi:hypothetical protein